MKRHLIIFIFMVLSLTGCMDRIKEPVTFYYVRNAYTEDMSGILASETREASGHREDLSYLMALYFMGPADDDLHSPIPRSVSLLSSSKEGTNVQIKLTDSSKVMTDSQFTLACSCLTLTCLEITEAQTVTISSGDRIITMSAENLLLMDLSTATGTEETQ